MSVTENNCDFFEGWDARFGSLLPVFSKSVSGGGKNLFAVSPDVIAFTVKAADKGEEVDVSPDVLELYRQAHAAAPNANSAVA